MNELASGEIEDYIIKEIKRKLRANYKSANRYLKLWLPRFYIDYLKESFFFTRHWSPNNLYDRHFKITSMELDLVKAKKKIVSFETKIHNKIDGIEKFGLKFKIEKINHFREDHLERINENL